MGIIRLVAASAVIAAAAFAGACEFKGGSAVGERPALSGAVWQPSPTTIRIYPSTRFVQDAGNTVLEARVELLDEMNDSIKGAGAFQFELYAAQRASDATIGGRLYAWDATVATLEQQRQFYDPITRAYVFRLRLDDPALSRRATLLRVLYTPPVGSRLEAEATLVTPAIPN